MVFTITMYSGRTTHSLTHALTDYRMFPAPFFNGAGDIKISPQIGYGANDQYLYQ